MKNLNLRGPRTGRLRLGGGSLFLGLVGVGLGMTLLAKPSKTDEPSSDRVHPDELPDPDDFRQQLEALGLSPTGERIERSEPAQLPEAQRLEVIDVPGQSVPEPVEKPAAG
jgi:hypothetical protein